MSSNATVLFVEHRGSLVKYAQGILRDRAGAEDVVQEAWLRFSAAAERGEIVQPVSYLYRIVRNLALDWANRRTAETRKATQPELDCLPSDAPDAERILYFKDELRVMAEALAELPERTRRIFWMYRIEGQSLRMIADQLGISIVRVHQLVKEGILHAARRLDDIEG